MLFPLQNEKKLRIKNISKYDLTFFLILVTFLCFAISYSLITPMFEAPDEPFHYKYPKAIVDGNLGPELYLRHQPLYYVILAGPLYFIDYPDEVKFVRNPLFPTDPARYLHGNEEIFPFSDTAQAVHILRFFSIFLGTITVIFTYKIAKLVFKKNNWMPLFSMAYIALIPKFLFINSALNNDVLIWTCTTIAIFYILKFSTKPDKTKFLILASIFTGLAIISKSSGVILIPMIFGIIMYLAFKKENKRSFLKNIFIFGIFSLIGGGWYVYFKIIAAYDPNNFHLGSIFSYFWGAQNSSTVSDLELRVGINIIDSFGAYYVRIINGVWGRLGWENISANEIFFHIALIFVVISLSGIILILFKKNYISFLRLEKNHLTILLFSVGFMQLMILGTMALGSGFARYGFPGLGPAVVLSSLGMYALFKSKKNSYMIMFIFIIFLVLLNIQLLIEMNNIFVYGLVKTSTLPVNELLDGKGTNPMNTRFTNIQYSEIENGQKETILFLHPTRNLNTWWNFTYFIPENENSHFVLEYGFLSGIDRKSSVQFGAYIDNQELFIDDKYYTGQSSTFEKSLKEFSGEKIEISIYTNSLGPDYYAWTFFKPQIFENYQ